MAGCNANEPQVTTYRIEQAPPTATEEPFYAWDFTLTTLDDTIVTLSDLRGQWVIINFWATWCEPCQQEIPFLNDLHTSQPDLVVLGVNVREEKALVQQFAHEYALAFPILLHPDDQMLINYNVMGLPQTLLVDPTGIVKLRQFGPLDIETFKAELFPQMRDT
ncbi:TlpA family protein disulfide reductase [Phototrophicus methaneseepsis]|uniref:TlpA family protein disulfide reductase n=1 Tax=Phototrophicus methaneseepsis TaxID=2710758 RepID=A0A7S8E6G8_9CHLR|nr:TlpA disulfide reductase family protein [Phototrophicus methaneseepsis]QPC81266.1 TlpA family protein disulfide reductase [Phototrophicus methaneseepsis]